jgi:hypothetical protein
MDIMRQLSLGEIQPESQGQLASMLTTVQSATAPATSTPPNDGGQAGNPLSSVVDPWSGAIMLDSLWNEYNAGVEGKPSFRDLFLEHGLLWLKKVTHNTKSKLTKFCGRLWLYRDEIMVANNMSWEDYKAAEEKAYKQMKTEAGMKDAAGVKIYKSFRVYREATWKVQPTQEQRAIVTPKRLAMDTALPAEDPISVYLSLRM